MARIVEGLPKKERSHKYDWDLWLDGQAREFDDPEIVNFVPNFRSAAKYQARLRGLRVHVQTEGGKVYVQSYRKPVVAEEEGDAV
jgi:hypothetical protein